MRAGGIDHSQSVEMRKHENNEVLLEEECGSYGYYHLQAIKGVNSIGSLTAIKQDNNTIQLSDILVGKDVMMRHIPFRSWLCLLWPRIGMKSFRGCGIGHRLLVHFLNYCRANGIAEAYGSIVQIDLDETPTLLAWYRRHGFEVLPPDSRCVWNAVSMVVWRNADPHSTGGTES